MKSFWVTCIISMAMWLASGMTLAAVPAWQIVPNESELTFTATQNGAPVTGKFKSFTGEIYFDPNQLDTSKVKIVIDTGSVSTDYGEIAQTLVTPDWFNSKLFPQATFTTNSITKIGGKAYQAKGTLTLRNITLPVTIDFTEDEYSASKARMKGSATLKRTTFGVGQGEWAATTVVKDDVLVSFVLTATKK